MLNSPIDVFMRRMKLLLQGNRQGVGAWILHQGATAHFDDANSFFNSYPEYSSKIDFESDLVEKYFDEIKVKLVEVVDPIWNSEKQLFQILYALTFSILEGHIVETGVANGFTTNAIMAAIKDNNGNACLNSFDILPETSNAYQGDGNWNFSLLPGPKFHKQLIHATQQLQNVKLWVHDSDHSYKWQKFEYLLAYNRMQMGGILISDDIDTSSAWIEVVPSLFSCNFVIFDSRKFIGIAIK